MALQIARRVNRAAIASQRQKSGNRFVPITYAGTTSLPRPALIDAHADAWSRIGAPGAFFSGLDRAAIVAEARHARGCRLCNRRRSALSPNAVEGRHDSAANLADVVIDVVHRLTTDPGRLTRRWFEGLRPRGLADDAYVEVVSLVATSVIIDTLHFALGLDAPPLPDVRVGAPSGVRNPDVGDEGAWLPLAPRTSDAVTATRMPAVPNIRRAMSLVPDAVALFFGAFMPHYRLVGLDFAISQAEAEYVASRVSALNQCFY